MSTRPVTSEDSLPSRLPRRIMEDTHKHEVIELSAESNLQKGQRNGTSNSIWRTKRGRQFKLAAFVLDVESKLCYRHILQGRTVYANYIDSIRQG